MIDIILIGGFSEIIELCEDAGYNIVGYIDVEKVIPQLDAYGYRYLGKDSSFDYVNNRDKVRFIITPDNPQVREKIFLSLPVSVHYAKIISPQAKISKTAFIGDGTCIQYGCHVSSFCKIGRFVKVNTYANIMHDSVIEDFTTVAPNAAIMGRVRIGKKCYIGANATVLPNIEICNDVTVGAGAVVTKDLNIPGKYVGIPARILIQD